MHAHKPSLVIAAAGAVLAVVAPACSLSVPPPLARVRRGPAFGAPPRRIMALPAVCVEEHADTCRPEYAAALESAARISLEFAGFSLIDSDQVNLRLGRRRERTHEALAGNVSSTHREVKIRRVTWAEATPSEQRALMAELEVDGFLSSRITIGASGLDGVPRTVNVTVSVMRARDHALVWRSRCAVDGRHHTTPHAVELATRCALESATLLR